MGGCSSTKYNARVNLVYEMEYPKGFIHPGTGNQSTFKVPGRNEKKSSLEVIKAVNFVVLLVNVCSVVILISRLCITDFGSTTSELKPKF